MNDPQTTGPLGAGPRRCVVEYSANDPDMIADSGPFLRDAREHTPTFFSHQDGGFWTVSRYDDVWEVLHDAGRFTSSVAGATVPVQTLSRGEGQGFIPLEFDDPLHARYRSVIAPLFAPKRIRSIEAMVRAGVTEVLEGLQSRSGVVDLISDLAVPFVTQALVAAIGLREGELGDLVAVMDAVLHSRSSAGGDPGAASERLRVYVRSLIADRRERPGDPSEDFFSQLHVGRVEGRPLSADEMESYGVDILLAGYESTINGIGASLHMIGTEEAVREAVLQNLDNLTRPVEEMLRMVAPVQLFGRNATADLDFHGQPMRQGEMVVMHFASANRDETVFPEPDAFVADRWPNRHVAFGAGAHFCLGAHLARQEIRVCLEAMLRAHPRFRVVDTPECHPVLGAHGDLRGYAYLPALLDPQSNT